MKKLIFVVMFGMLSVPALAGPHHGHHRHHHWNHHHPHHWVAPAIIGGVIGYALTRPATPIIVEQQVIPATPVCTEWREVQQADGSIIRERYCKQ